MSHRDWVPKPPLGVGLICAALLLTAWLNNHQNKSAPNQQAPAQEQREASVAGTIPTPPPEPEPDRNEWRQERDLQAQRDMAEWARWMLIVSALGVVVATFGVWLIRETLIATRDTLGEAKATTKAALDAADEAKKQTAAANRSADAAVKQNEISRQQLLEASRPELFGSVEKADLDDYIAGRNEMPIITIRLDNFGERTAIIEDAYADLLVADKSPIPTANLPIALSGRTAIAAQGHSSDLVIAGKLSASDLEAVQKQNARFFVCGYVPYQDRMGGAWEVGFCFEYWFLQLDMPYGDATVTHQNWSPAGGSKCNFDRPRTEER